MLEKKLRSIGIAYLSEPCGKSGLAVLFEGENGGKRKIKWY